MELKETKQILNTFAKYVIQQSRSNLSKDKKNVSKALYDSLDYEIMANKDFVELSFSMEEYGRIKIRSFRNKEKL